eukprot:scaffold650612_cov45-Prasinocladus_malaysianus.AAC.1
MLSGFARSMGSNSKRVKMLKRHLRFTAGLRDEQTRLQESLNVGEGGAAGTEWIGISGAVPEGPWVPVMALIRKCKEHQ